MNVGSSVMVYGKFNLVHVDPIENIMNFQPLGT